MNKRLKNVYMFLRCIVHAPFRGRALKDVLPPRRILVCVVTANLGDAICITPIFREIRLRYPDCEIVAMGRKKVCEVFDGNPHIRKNIVMPEAADILIETIKSLHIDFAVLTHPSAFVLGALFLADIPSIASFASSSSSVMFPRSYQFLVQFVARVPFVSGGYIPRNYLKLLRPMAIESDNVTFELYCSSEAIKSRDEFLKGHGIQEADFVVIIAPGGSTDIRWWPAERYAAIADYLQERYGARILLVGAGGDSKPMHEVVGLVKPETQCVELYNQSIDEFKSFVARANLVLGNDSGPMMAAEALATPSIVFIGPTNEKEYHPWSGGRNRVLVAPDRGIPETHSLNWHDYDPEEAHRQIRAITFEQAKKEVDDLLIFLKIDNSL